MELRTHINGDVLYAAIVGELDHHCAADVREKLDKELMNNSLIRNIEFDLERLTFMDSSGIGVIMGRYKLIQKRGGRMYASHIRPQVEKLLSISGLMNIITII